MSFSGAGSLTTLDGLDLLCSNGNWRNYPQRRSLASYANSFAGSLLSARGVKGGRVKCSIRGAVSASEGNENAQKLKYVHADEDSSHVMKFNISDFEICNYVSVGLAGRSDEVIYEATVKDPISTLYNSRVVLRQLASPQAKRRGRRAIEVLKRLARRQLLYHSYAMQVHGYLSPSGNSDDDSFTLVHGYHGSYSLRHWLQLSNWFPILEVTLALDEECVRRVGDDRVGGPAISRKLRLIRILMRDLLIGVNYLHSHGLAHTELRLENLHISPVDRHIKVGILGNASDFHDNSPNNSTVEGNAERRQMMIAFDMRCVGFIMAQMVLQELIEPSIFMKFKLFLNKGNDPSCLREFLLPILSTNSASGNAGLQMLDRNWGAGWNLLSQLLATKSLERISCLDALRHPFLCGPRWRVEPSVDMIKWGLGSTAVRITEEYIYGLHQRNRLAYFIELIEMLNPHTETEDWLELLPGRWRLLYSTGRHIGLTLRQPLPQVLMGNVILTIDRSPDSKDVLSFTSNIEFSVMISPQWPHNKTGIPGKLQCCSSVRLAAGSRHYLQENSEESSWRFSTSQESTALKLSNRKWRGTPIEELPSSLPVAKLACGEVDVTMNLDSPSLQEVNVAGKVLKEVRTQIPPEMFDLSKFVCGTYLDSRMLVLRGVNGSALLLTRSNRVYTQRNV
ncbi:probable plastid-lipid-associated protein 14, chloroplastic isoform X2 [Aristolochia californica]